MLILNIETSTNVGSVSLSRDGSCWILREEKESGDHARQLTVFIEEVMDVSGLSLKDIDAVAVSAGPGSYTGLRIGVSVAKGICYTLNKPLLAVNTLKSMAYGLLLNNKPGPNDLIVSVQDARRMDAYAAVYNYRLETIKEPFFLTLETDYFLDLIAEDGKIYVCGTATDKWSKIVDHPSFVFSELQYPSSRFMEKLSHELSLNKQIEDTAYFEPFYLKAPNVTLPKNPL